MTSKNSLKRFYIQYGIGKVKYVISFFDGIQKHKDDSDFYNIQTFKNKKNMEKFIQQLYRENYKENGVKY